MVLQPVGFETPVPSAPILKFPPTIFGTSSQLKFKLTNPSKVAANVVTHHQHTQAHPASFRLSVNNPVIEPGQTIDVTATFQPVRINEEVTEYFNLSVVMGTRINITCQGSCTGPKVRHTSLYIHASLYPTGHDLREKHQVLAY